MWTKKITQLLVLPLLIVTFLLGCLTNVKAETNDDFLQKVKDKGELVMGTSPDFPPYEFIQKIDGKSEVVGMDVEVGKKIAEDIGVKLVIQRMDFNSLLVALETGKVDMVISGMSKTPERAKSVEFSDVYYKSGQDLIIRKKDADKYRDYRSFADKTIGAQTASLQYNLVQKQAKKSKLKGMDKNSDLILALQTNKIDAVATDSGTADAFVENTEGLVKIKSGFKLGDMQGSAVAFPKGAHSLVETANKSISEIKSQDLIRKEYLPQAGKYLTGGKSKKEKAAANSMWAYKDFFLAGVGYTLMISAVSVIFGLILGTLLTLMRLSTNKIISSIAAAYVEFVRGTPLMVQLLFIYFGLGLIVKIPALLSGIIAVSLNSSAYIEEVIRSGINAVPVGQTEASRSLGMSKFDTLRYVILPQAMKNIWPALGNEFVSLIKESSIVSVIGVQDLIYQSRIVQADTYRGVMPLVVTMILYFIITFSLSRLMRIWERRMNHENN